MCDFCVALNDGQEGRVQVTLPKDITPTLTDDNAFIIPLEQVGHVVATELRRMAQRMDDASRKSPLGYKAVPFGLAWAIMSDSVRKWADQLDPTGEK